MKRKDAQKIDINLLTVAYLKKAEREIYKHSQLESFPTEYRHLINNQEVKKTSPLLSLRPFISDGLIRVGGRIAKSHLPFKNKHQIVVAKDHPLSKLRVIHHHKMPLWKRTNLRTVTRNCVDNKWKIIDEKSIKRMSEL